MASQDETPAARAPDLSACDHTVQIPLSRQFLFLHEPLRREALAGLDADVASKAVPLVGRRPELEELLLRLGHSRGGCFLITGYRGVGKTSFVNHAIGRLRAELRRGAFGGGGPSELVDVHLSLARTTDPMGVLFRVIDGLHQGLREHGLLGRLPSDLRSELEIAWQRTSFQIASSRTRSSETEGSVEGAAWLGLTPSLSHKESRSDQLDLQYLAYDERAAERDLIRITQRLAGGFAAPRRLADRLCFWRRPPAPLKLKIVLVFDELDKLQEAADAKSTTPVDELIAVLKNLLTTSGICFLFIAGKDLEERWRQDVGAGDSIYESVFSFNRYLPALWDDTNELVNVLVDAPSNAGWKIPPGHDPELVFQDFRDFVAFHGRGIPRRSLRLLHGFVRWNGERCVVGFRRRDYRRMRFFAGLEVLLREHRDLLLQTRDPAVDPADRDHARLGLYYLVDWILAQGEASFTAAEAVEASRRMSRKIAFVERLAVPAVRDLIELLIEQRYLEKTEGTSLLKVQRQAAPEPRYRVAPDRLRQLGGAEAAAKAGALPTAPQARLAKVGRFELRELIGEGGFGKVHRAIDPESGREVAVKLLAPDAARLPDMRARFLREAEFLRRLNEPGHEGVVRFLEHGEAPGGELYAAMEYVEGTTLRELLGLAPLELELALSIARRTALAYGYVHGKGARRLDVKPGNIVVAADGRIVVMDFGIALFDGASEPEIGVEFVGTPAYSAPEQIKSEPIDVRADVFSLGVVLFEMLARRKPWEGQGGDLAALHERIAGGPVPRVSAHVNVPKSVDDLVARAMAPKREQRFASMKEMADALAAALAPAAAAAPSAPSAPSPPPAPALKRSRPPTAVKEETKFFTIPARPSRPAAAPAAARPASPAAPKPGGLLRVVRLSQDQSILDSFDVPMRDGLVIGRSKPSDVTLDAAEVSRRHAVIERGPLEEEAGAPRWYLRDLAATNGTFLNGQVVRDRVELNAGDVIRIGDYELFRA